MTFRQMWTLTSNIMLKNNTHRALSCTKKVIEFCKNVLNWFLREVVTAIVTTLKLQKALFCSPINMTGVFIKIWKELVYGLWPKFPVGLDSPTTQHPPLPPPPNPAHPTGTTTLQQVGCHEALWNVSQDWLTNWYTNNSNNGPCPFVRALC